MREQNLTRIVVTLSDGVLVGVVRREDLDQRSDAPRSLRRGIKGANGPGHARHPDDPDGGPAVATLET
jgi:hypothetical protein